MRVHHNTAEYGELTGQVGILLGEHVTRMACSTAWLLAHSISNSQSADKDTKRAPCPTTCAYLDVYSEPQQLQTTGLQACQCARQVKQHQLVQYAGLQGPHQWAQAGLCSTQLSYNVPVGAACVGRDARLDEDVEDFPPCLAVDLLGLLQKIL